MHVSYTLVFHQSKCMSTNRRMPSIVAIYIRSNFFMYLCVPCYCDACLKSSALCLGMKTFNNTIPGAANTSMAIDCSIAKSKLVDRAWFCIELARYLNLQDTFHGLSADSKKRFWRCVIRSCQCRLHTDVNDVITNQLGHHTYGSDAAGVEVAKIKANTKRRALDTME